MFSLLLKRLSDVYHYCVGKMNVYKCLTDFYKINVLKIFDAYVFVISIFCQGHTLS